MPPWMLVLTLAAADTAAPSTRARDAWIGADKVKHTAVAFAIQGGSYATLRIGANHGSALAGATLVTAGLSLLKERLDRNRSGFSVRDLVWDAAGAVAASLILSHAPRR